MPFLYLNWIEGGLTGPFFILIDDSTERSDLIFKILNSTIKYVTFDKVKILLKTIIFFGQNTSKK